MKKYFLLFLFIFAQNVFAFDKVKVQLNWFHQFEFAGFYAAIKEGYFKDANIEVELIEGGPGVPDNEKKRIFDTFEENSRTRSSAGGRGLGLSIVASIARAHNGTVKVLDRDGGGSIFVIEIENERERLEI